MGDEAEEKVPGVEELIAFLKQHDPDALMGILLGYCSSIAMGHREFFLIRLQSTLRQLEAMRDSGLASC